MVAALGPRAPSGLDCHPACAHAGPPRPRAPRSPRRPPALRSGAPCSAIWATSSRRRVAPSSGTLAT
eukprot:14514772-Alexandrium_andersonii.AAC.1